MPTADDRPVSDAEADLLFANLADAPALLLAVSGGPDSTALLLLAARWRRRLKHGPALFAVTVDHGLRAEAKREAGAVKRLARSLGIAHRTVRWTADKPSTGLQQQAREARYDLLVGAARRHRARHLLVAHTRDDQAETVLIRMARGSGLTGLAAMARAGLRDGVLLVRPFLDLPKTRLIATLHAANIPFAEDPSNRDPRYTRARLRALMPRLAEEGLHAARLALLARRLQRADRAIEMVADLVMRMPGNVWGARVIFDEAGFAMLPGEIALRLMGRAIARVGDEGPVELGKLEALMAALARALGAGTRFRRTLAGAMITLARGQIAVERAPPRRNPPKSPRKRR